MADQPPPTPTTWVDDRRLFRNRGSDAGSDHTLDVDWTLVEVDLATLPPDMTDDGEVVLHWTLQSDPGLEFGGWHIDDVCMVQLADIPGHYRRMQLTAALDAEFRVQLAWENPWIAPLDTVRLVAEPGDALEDVELAVQLAAVDLVEERHHHEAVEERRVVLGVVDGAAAAAETV